MVERGSSCCAALQHYQCYHWYVLDWIHGPGHVLLQLLAYRLPTHQLVSTSMSDRTLKLTAVTGHSTDSERPTISSTSPTTGVSSTKRCTKHTPQPTCLPATSRSTSGSLQPMPPSYPMLFSTTVEKCKSIFTVKEGCG